MKERPILFSRRMVRAILDGRKTQTRRPVKPQPFVATPSMFDASKCPLGQPGDRLWVRETWCPVNLHQSHGCCYRADDDLRELQLQPGTNFCWRPSIHMPRWASRITLEIVRVWVERVNDITPDDCRAEGQPDENNDIGARYGFGRLWQSIYGTWYANPWVWAVEFRRTK